MTLGRSFLMGLGFSELIYNTRILDQISQWLLPVSQRVLVKMERAEWTDR